VIGKLALIVAVIVVGAFVIGPAEGRLLDTPLSDSSRARNQGIVLAGGLFDIGALLAATGLSVFKPGRPRQRGSRTQADSAVPTQPDEPVERRDFETACAAEARPATVAAAGAATDAASSNPGTGKPPVSRSTKDFAGKVTAPVARRRRRGRCRARAAKLGQVPARTRRRSTSPPSRSRSRTATSTSS